LPLFTNSVADKQNSRLIENKQSFPELNSNTIIGIIRTDNNCGMNLFSKKFVPNIIQLKNFGLLND